jgi:hypothetical protein
MICSALASTLSATLRSDLRKLSYRSLRKLRRSFIAATYAAPREPWQLGQAKPARII